MADNIDNDLLISLVEERPVLWDKTIEEYKDKDKKNSAWKEVCRSIFPTFDEQTNKEKTKIDILQALKEAENRHLSFFKAILPSLNKLDDHQTLIFQSRVLQVLTDLHQP
ncbi:uncharacterized protein LOC134661985, partial [Cydia amplana]|uniref:uncharacterized protein LOC134661985 n=1 Tax=Cydia amplana TaxID=1869771 RepID=UPI002FE53BA2